MPDDAMLQFKLALLQAVKAFFSGIVRKGGRFVRRQGRAGLSAPRRSPLFAARHWRTLAAVVAMASVSAVELASAQQDVYTVPVVVWPYTDFGRPGVVVSTRTDARLGTTTVTFATGARLIVKPTQLSPGQVTVIASFGNGRSGVPERLVHALWATTLFPVGGTRKLSFAEIDQWQRTSGHAVNVTLVPTTTAFQLKSEVPSSEIITEMQLLTAYARDPGFRQEAVNKIASVGPLIASQIDGDPASAFMRGVQHTLVGSRYQELPERSDIEATTGKELPQILGSALATRPDVVIVGDISVEEAIPATAATFAAGEHRPSARRVLVSAEPPAPGAQPAVFEHKGLPDDAWLGEYWPLPDLLADPTDRIAQISAALLEARMRKALLSSWHIASPPIVRSVTSLELRGEGELGIALELHPADITAARARIQMLMRDLVEARISADEVARARLAVAATSESEESSK